MLVIAETPLVEFTNHRIEVATLPMVGTAAPISLRTRGRTVMVAVEAAAAAAAHA